METIFRDFLTSLIDTLAGGDQWRSGGGEAQEIALENDLLAASNQWSTAFQIPVPNGKRVAYSGKLFIDASSSSDARLNAGNQPGAIGGVFTTNRSSQGQGWNNGTVPVIQGGSSLNNDGDRVSVIKVVEITGITEVGNGADSLIINFSQNQFDPNFPAILVAGSHIDYRVV